MSLMRKKLANKKVARLRRAKRLRCAYREKKQTVLTINKTPRHTYAQVIEYTTDGMRVIAAASTVEKSIREALGNQGGNIAAAQLVGQHVAERAIAAGVLNISFDRSGFRYHGRVKQIAESAREHGLKF